MALASRGLRDMDGGLERLERQDLAAVRGQARRIHLKAFLAALAYAVAAVAIP